jgi:hypothetical protein
MSLTGCEGGAVALPGTAEAGGGVVGGVFAGAGGAVAMHRAVLHMIISITMVIILFTGITTVIMVMRNTCVEKPLFSHIFSNLPRHFFSL